MSKLFVKASCTYSRTNQVRDELVTSVDNDVFDGFIRYNSAEPFFVEEFEPSCDCELVKYKCNDTGNSLDIEAVFTCADDDEFILINDLKELVFTEKHILDFIDEGRIGNAFTVKYEISDENGTAVDSGEIKFKGEPSKLSESYITEDINMSNFPITVDYIAILEDIAEEVLDKKADKFSYKINYAHRILEITPKEINADDESWNKIVISLIHDFINDGRVWIGVETLAYYDDGEKNVNSGKLFNMNDVISFIKSILD